MIRASMTKALVIAEKPSVASDIAKALGGFTKHDDVFERDDMVVASAVGHLLELIAPEKYDVKRGKWSFNHLPVIPPHFDLQPIAKSEAKLKTLAKLVKNKEIDTLVNACDAGREGELIFRYIVQHTKAKQPIKRLWLQSMTPNAIRDAFAHLRSDQDMVPLADAARCRSEADWLVGINGTRAMTAFNSKEGGFFLTTVGRVQTPTLAVVVEREEKIRKFVARDYFEVLATFQASAGSYEGRWFDPQHKKNESDPEQKAERLWKKEPALEIAKACQGKPAVVTDESKPSSQIAPALFDLTSLQREANARFGISAKNTLGLAQALYEKHKVLTYPRTDSKALPEDYIGTVKETIQSLGTAAAFTSAAQEILKNSWIKPNKRIFDNSKVSDHFAIIPTGVLPKALSEPEQKIFELVVRRFLAVFYPAAEFLVTTRISQIEQHHFKTEGKILVNPGWMSVYGKDAASDDQASLVPVKLEERPQATPIQINELKTKPPARYTEATLLSAMEGAGKLVEDDELREVMAGKGLGTPATRAQVIEGLIAEKYLLRDGRELIPTAKAFQLMTLLRGLDVKELSLPELTGEWEYKLKQIETGRLTREQFMRDIAEMTERLVGQAKNYTNETIPGDYATLQTPCPKCGGVIKENYRRFACGSCDFSITKVPGGRAFELPEVEQLIKEKEIGPLDGFRSKMGRPFMASLKITPDHKLEFDFGNAHHGDDAEPVDFSGKPSLGSCPKCTARVFAHGSAYVCEKSVGPAPSCDFRTGMMILQQAIAPEQIEKLLSTGKTDLLDGFVSARTRRKFKAYLAKTPEGKIGFEFETRPEKPKVAKTTKTTQATKTTKVSKGTKASKAKKKS